MVSTIDTVIALITAAVYIVGLVGFFRPSAKITIYQVVMFLSIMGTIVAVLEAMRVRPEDGSVVWSAVAWILFAVSHVFFLSALFSHGRRRPNVAFCIESPLYFVRTGAYGWVRHPFYVSYILAWLATVAMTRNVVVAACVAWLIVLYVLAARREEASFCGTTYSADHENYRRTTGFFVPRLRSSKSLDVRSNGAPAEG